MVTTGAAIRCRWWHRSAAAVRRSHRPGLEDDAAALLGIDFVLVARIQVYDSVTLPELDRRERQDDAEIFIRCFWRLHSTGIPRRECLMRN